MDVDEIMEGIMGSYDPTTQTFGTYDFTSGLNKDATFDLNKYGIGTQLGPFGLKTTGVTGEPLGTKYIDQTPDFTSHPSTMPSVMGQVLGKVSPIDINTLKSTLNRMNQLETMKASGVTQDKINDYYDRAQGKGKYDIFGGGDGNGGGPKPYLPIDYNTGAATVEAIEPYTNDFAYRFGTGQNVGADVLRGYAANGGRIGRAFGGIMDTATGRKAYGLGSVFKSVGKAVKGVAKAAGKVLKSDLGKAAILAGGYYYGGGSLPFIGARQGASGFGTTGIFSGLKDRVAGSDFFSKMLMNKDKTGFSPFKVASLASPLLAFTDLAKAPVDQMPDGMSNRGGKLKDSQGNEVVPSEIRDEIKQAYESGDAGRIREIENYYAFLPPINQYLPYPNYAQGGRIGYDSGGKTQLELPFGEPDYYIGKGKNKVGIYRQKDGKLYAVPIGIDGLPSYAQGGRIGYSGGGMDTPDKLYKKAIKAGTFDGTFDEFLDELERQRNKFMAQGGRIGAQEGGLMDLGGMEKDYRNEGGFVPIGGQERADDVPARLSKNEFVFTADAVRAAGDGDIDKGAEVMENVMENLEKGGNISEESQGLEGARDMFATSQRLEGVL